MLILLVSEVTPMFPVTEENVRSIVDITQSKVSPPIIFSALIVVLFTRNFDETDSRKFVSSVEEMERSEISPLE